jgi:hypothetical protein
MGEIVSVRVVNDRVVAAHHLGREFAEVQRIGEIIVAIFEAVLCHKAEKLVTHNPASNMY